MRLANREGMPFVRGVRCTGIVGRARFTRGIRDISKRMRRFSDIDLQQQTSDPPNRVVELRLRLSRVRLFLQALRRSMRPDPVACMKCGVVRASFECNRRERRGGSAHAQLGTAYPDDRLLGLKDGMGNARILDIPATRTPPGGRIRPPTIGGL